MNGQRLGSAVRATRLRRKLRQRDVAERAGLSQSTISRIERGHVQSLTVAAIEAPAAVLDIRVDLVPRWRGGDLDRLLNARHSALHDAIASWFARRWQEWTLSPEVSYAVYGERGVIDLVAWHERTQSLLVVELKTAIVDVNVLVGKIDQKRRLAPEAVRPREWRPRRVGAWVVVAESRTNRRHRKAHSSFIRNALPDGRAAVRSWLAKPTSTGLSAISIETFASARVARSVARVRRVHSSRAGG